MSHFLKFWTVNVESAQRHRFPYVSAALDALPGGSGIIAIQEHKRGPKGAPAFVAGKKAYLSCLQEGKAGCGFLVDQQLEPLVEQKEDIIPGRMFRLVLAGEPQYTLLVSYMPLGKEPKSKPKKSRKDGAKTEKHDAEAPRDPKVPEATEQADKKERKTAKDAVQELRANWAKLADIIGEANLHKRPLIIFGDFNAVVDPESGGRSSGKPQGGNPCRDSLMKKVMKGMIELTVSVGYTWKGNGEQGTAPEARLDGIWSQGGS